MKNGYIILFFCSVIFVGCSFHVLWGEEDSVISKNNDNIQNIDFEGSLDGVILPDEYSLDNHVGVDDFFESKEVLFNDILEIKQEKDFDIFEVDEELISEVNEDFLENDIIMEIDTMIVCDLGYYWDGESCVSFCSAERYFEPESQTCMDYPCCDYEGLWKVVIYQQDASSLVLSANLSQKVAVLQGTLTNIPLGEVYYCNGSLQKKVFSLECLNYGKKFVFSSTNALAEKVTAFCLYSDSSVQDKQLPFVFEKL